MKFAYLLSFGLLSSYIAGAQHNLGVATGGWSSINSIYLNPANIAESREKKSVNAIGGLFYVDNNAGPFNAGKGLVVVVGDGSSNDMFRYTNNSKVSMMAPYFNIMGPGAVHRIDKKSSVAITSRLRGMNQFNNFDQTLFNAFSDPTYKPEENRLALPRNFAYTVHMWLEVGATYAKTVWEKDDKKLKLGGTFRYLGGIAWVGVKGKEMNANFTSGNYVFNASNTDIEYSSNVLNTVASQGNNIGRSFGRLISGGRFGHGIGGDIGAVYEYKPKGGKAKTGHATKFGLSVNDIGGIAYGKRVNTNQVINGEGDVTAKGILDNVKNFANMERYVEQKGLTATTRSKSTYVYMPTHIIASADYHLKKHYYVYAMTLVNLASRKAYGNSFYNQFSIVPRYETKNLTIAVPVTYATLSNRIKTGVGFNFGNFYVGSDDILAFAIRSEYGINMYMGVTKRFYK